MKKEKEIEITIDRVMELAIFMHTEYENIAKQTGWKTQKKTQVEFDDLPIENRATMLMLAEKILALRAGQKE